MAESRRGLGRGLSALLDEVEATPAPEGPARGGGPMETPIELLHPNPDQPRKLFTEPTQRLNLRAGQSRLLDGQVVVTSYEPTP